MTCASMWKDPELYDLENADDPAFDVAFWTGLVARRGAFRVLELGCGTGRLTVPLASLPGVSVVGLDSSPSFLERAASRVDGLPASLVEGDMRSPGVVGPFDLVVAPFNALSYLIGVEDRARAVAAARALLAPGGAFAFDVVAPRYDFLAEAAASCPVVRMDADHAAVALGVTRFIRTYVDRYDPATQTLRSTNRYEIHRADGRVEHRVGDLDWHIYFPAELELLLSGAGLRVVERFGGWDGAPWGPSSRRMLWVCEAS